MLMSVAIGSAAFSQKTVEARKTFLPGNFEKLVINCDTKVVLREGVPAVVIEGNPGFVNSFRILPAKKGVVTINSNFSSSRENDMVIIYVKNLKDIYVNGDANVFSSDVLQSRVLRILLDGTASLNVTNNGKIRVSTTNAYEFDSGR